MKFPIGEDRIPLSWLPPTHPARKNHMDLLKAAEIVYGHAKGNLEEPMFTPLPTAEVIHLRVQNKQREVARISRAIAEKEQRVSDLAHEIWLLKLEREGVQGRG